MENRLSPVRSVNTDEIQRKFSFSVGMTSANLGNDGCIYMVYGNQVIRTAWNNSSANDSEHLSFGQNFADIQKVMPSESGFLVMGKLRENAPLFTKSGSQRMKVYSTDTSGNIKAEIFLGRVYGNKCHVTSRGNIAAGYFDQDITEDTRIESGFCLWDQTGIPVWSDACSGIADCHAVHIGEKSIWYAVNDDSVIRLHEKIYTTECFAAPVRNIVDLCCNRDETYFLFAAQKIKYGQLEKYTFHTCRREGDSFADVLPLDTSCITPNIIKGFSFHRGCGIVWDAVCIKCFALEYQLIRS